MIPANDDASKSIEVILDAVCAAMAEGLEERKVEKLDAAEDKEENADAAPGKRRRVRRNDAAKDAAPAVETPAAEETAE